MGSYLNPGNEKFKEALNSPIYVDTVSYTHLTLPTNREV